MRTTLVARMQLVASQLQIEGTIRGLLKVYGLKIGAVHRNRFSARVLELLEMAALPELSAAIEPLLRVREGMRIERKLADRTLAASARRSDVGRRLMTIPGVGPVTSLAYIATVDEPSRFGTSKALGAHLGLTPRVYQSGQIGTNQQMRRSNAAAPPLRGCIGADDTYPQMVSSKGLGRLRRQASGHEARHCRGGSQARGDHASHLGQRR
jgi:transposase